MTTEKLLGEAAELLTRARQAAKLEAAQQHNDSRRTKMNYEDQAQTTAPAQQPTATHSTLAITPHSAGELYAGGKSVIEVAQVYGITYGKARKLIKDSGTPIRDASSRLKGRTRRPRSAD